MIPEQRTVHKLRELQTYLRTEPRRLIMDLWGVSAPPEKLPHFLKLALASWDSPNDKLPDVSEVTPPCGTAGCLAGNICMMAGLIRPSEYEYLDQFKGRPVYKFGYDTSEKAVAYLEISTPDARRLFYLPKMLRHNALDREAWPKKFADELEKSKPGTPEYTEVVCRRVDYYIETGN